MNILVSVSTLAFGGAEKQAVLDANMLSSHHTVFFLTFKNGELATQLRPEIKLLLVDKTNYIVTAWRVLKILKKYKIDIVHAHLFAPMVLSSLASIFSRASIIWNFHSHSYEDSAKARPGQKYLAKLPTVKKILFPANELKEYYLHEGYNFSEKKSLIFYNSTQVDGKINIEKIQNQNNVIGFIGRVIPLKRLHLLVDLAAELLRRKVDNFEIWIIGDGPDRKRVEAYADEKKIGHKVKFLGFQSDTIKYYQQFDIFILPSEEEVLSLALIDAGMLGVASIAFDVGGNRDIVDDNETGFIVSSEGQLFDRVEELLKSEDLRIKMGSVSKERCLKKFGSETREKNLLSLYDEVV
jgi:L-malate glycosyltransferase